LITQLFCGKFVAVYSYLRQQVVHYDEDSLSCPTVCRIVHSSSADISSYAGKISPTLLQQNLTISRTEKNSTTRYKRRPV